MVEEHGKVLSVKGDVAIVQVDRGTGCDSCITKEFCKNLSRNDEMIIEATNQVGAKAGEHVELLFNPGEMIKAGMLFYLIPMITFIAGVILGQNIDTGLNKDLVSLILGLAFLVFTYTGIRVYGKISTKNARYKAAVLRVI